MPRVRYVFSFVKEKITKKKKKKKLAKFFYVISAYLYTFMELRNRVKNILYAKTSNLRNSVLTRFLNMSLYVLQERNKKKLLYN